MPEEKLVATELDEVLDQLEDYTWNLHNYQAVQDALESNKIVNVSTLQKLLEICIKSLNDSSKYTLNTLNIIVSIIKKVKDKQCDSVPDLVPSAVAVLHILKTTALFNKVEALKQLCFEIVLTYPDETLITLAVNHSQELMELFNLYCHQRVPVEARLQPINIISKLLKILPPDKKTRFVEEGLSNKSVWFSNVIPTVVLYLNTQNARVDVPMEALEMLTEELVRIDYSDIPQWHIVSECLYTPQRYPAIMKSLIEKDVDVWHRLWIVFIKLLKDQLTKLNKSSGSAINSMLPVVEMAFKMNSKNRCKAFLCWKVLIDNFSVETNDTYINKRIKLLIIPLMSNNAKVEETALAKLQTWWHLIVRFYAKLDMTWETILIPFLHFCFGKPHVDKQVLIPGMISDVTKKQCIEAFVEITGHSNCSGCGNWPKLEGKVLNTKYLVNNWSDWIHSMVNVVKNSAHLGTESSRLQVKCAWKSFVITLGELPENKVKTDLFTKVLSSIEKLVMECNLAVANIVANILLPTLFDDNEKIRTLINLKTDYSFSKRIVLVLVKLMEKHNFDVRYETISNIKPITNYFVQESIQEPAHSIEWLLQSLPTRGFLVWTALAESICDLKYSACPQMLCNQLLWPLKDVDMFKNNKESISAWLKLYNYVYPKNKNINKQILNTLLPCKFTSSNHFIIDASISMLNQKFSDKHVAKFDKEAELLFKVSDYSSWMTSEDCLQNLINVTIIILKKITANIDIKTAENTIKIVKQLLNAVKQLLNDPSINESNVLELLEDLLQSLYKMLKIKEYSNLQVHIIDELIECVSVFKKKESLLELIKSMYQCLCSVKNDDSISLKVNVLAEKIGLTGIICNISDKKNEQNLSKSQFTSPESKLVSKKAKKKEPSIVSTVVEDGEEYVVVKSNWKFNPRKLTDNQKEKLRKKREDIPALYQDLSQSQDEFKLTTWKTDSQDSSTTSKSLSVSANEDISSLFKSIPNSDIVPTILENMKPSNENIVNTDENNKEKNNELKINDQKVLTVDSSLKVQGTKSTRMALKDRVFRNVRNLIEKSSLSKECKDLNCSVLENITKTPTSNTVLEAKKFVNSAPSKICLDRPSRVKRKPKKFDDLQLFDVKKRRSSCNLDDSNMEPTNEGNCDERVFDTKNNKTENVELKKCNTTNNILTDPTMLSEPQSIPNLKIIPESESQLIMSPENILKPKCISPSLNIPDIKVMSKLPSTQPLLLPDSEILHSNSQKKSELSTESDPIIVADVIVQTESQMASETPSQANVQINSNDVLDVQESAAIQCIQVVQSSNVKNDAVVDINVNDKDEMAIDSKNNRKFDISKYEHTNKITISKDDQVNSSLPTVLPNQKFAMSTPKTAQKTKNSESQKSSPNSTSKISRIEKNLAIDMVEGHPYLKQKSQKRVTRKSVLNTPYSRKTVSDKLNKSKQETKNIKTDKKCKDKDKMLTKGTPVKNNDDVTSSQDVIESSQDSTITTISINSPKNSNKKLLVVSLENINISSPSVLFDTQNLNKSNSPDEILTTADNNLHNKDDTEIPRNKTAEKSFDNSIVDLVKNMDTEEPLYEINSSDDVIFISDNDKPSDVETQELQSNAYSIPEAETQLLNSHDTANIDTQLVNCNDIRESVNPQHTADADTQFLTSQDTALADTQSVDPSYLSDSTNSKILDVEMQNHHNENVNTNLTNGMSSDDSKTLLNVTVIDEGTCSPIIEKEEGYTKRKSDFLNNTLEISPIKTMSPVVEKLPSPATNSDYVIIKLTTPVESNGEPFEKSTSPEVFTEDRVCLDKRDQSPPREEISANNISPSSSLSLKKNRPQVRSGGRGAQMLGLCVPNRLQTIMMTEKHIESEEIKKNTLNNTSARRNLRILYNSSENNDNSDESEESEYFLKLKRTVPTTECSPSGPILKRKLVDIIDDATVSPASKRKRVSFHDPPVSTTVCVKKYIEPCGIRSPQNSAIKRLERQTKQQVAVKSPKKLENLFKLESVLTKTIESFNDVDATPNSNNTTVCSLEPTPVIEVVMISDLNDTDPICPDLIHCEDPIENIATELSSPTMKALLVKEFEGNIDTVGDLAKMTELQINRLCIKAPKVQIAKRVLSDYAEKVKQVIVEITPTVEAAMSETMITDLKVTVGIQTTDMQFENVEVQTDATEMVLATTQTNPKVTSHISTQTEETGIKSTMDIIKSCILERPDFMDTLCSQLDDNFKEKVANELSTTAITDILIKKMTQSNSSQVLTKIIEEQHVYSTNDNDDKRMVMLKEYLCDKFQPRDLVLFCSNLLKRVYEKPS